MRNFRVCLALSGVSILLTGCGMQFGSSSLSATRGGLAVVDLDKVATETGKSLEMKRSLELQENSVKQQVVSAQLSANSQLETKKQEFGETPNEDQQKDLVRFSMNARNALGKMQNQAGTLLGQYKQDQIAKFRLEIKPIAQEVASRRGLSVVIPKNEGLLLAVDPGVDITEDVIKVYLEKHPTPNPMTASETQAPATQKNSTPSAPVRTATTPNQRLEKKSN